MAIPKIPRGERGRQFADLVINQTEVKADGTPDDGFITNHVIRALRAQARAGVGTEPGMLPAAAFAHLMDRFAGKESEKLAVRQPGKPFEGKTSAEMATRLAELRAQIEPTDH
jgi:hypothetical protein